jgi:hypothetical protein
MDDSQKTDNATVPVSLPNKEIGSVSDYVQESAKKPEIPKEVSEAGVEEIPQAPELDKQAFKAGVQHFGPTTPVSTEPSQAIKLPMTEEEAKNNAKGNTSDSRTWLSRLVSRLFQRMRFVPKGV